MGFTNRFDGIFLGKQQGSSCFYGSNHFQENAYGWQTTVLLEGIVSLFPGVDWKAAAKTGHFFVLYGEVETVSRQLSLVRIWLGQIRNVAK